MVPALKTQILSQLDQMAVPEQEKVLNFARTLLAHKQPAGVPGHSLLAFAGTVEAEELELMTQAIEDDCGQIDLDAW